jgi:hypothetical protein
VDIYIFYTNSNTDNFLSDLNTNKVFNLEPDMDTNTDNYPDPDIFKILIFNKRFIIYF